MPVEIVRVDYTDEQHSRDLVMLLDAYAQDPMGGSAPLSSEVKDALVPQLAKRPNAFSFIAYVDGQPAGLINCFEGFSTFKARPLINVHDVVVVPEFRGRGLASQMFQRIEQFALERGCCKLTLEVLSANTAAQSLYRKLGFGGYSLDAETGCAQFWEKKL